MVLLALRGDVRPWLRNPVVLATIAFLVAYVIAAVFALDRYIAVFGSHDRLLGVLADADIPNAARQAAAAVQ